jgi:hypothetical protein
VGGPGRLRVGEVARRSGDFALAGVRGAVELDGDDRHRALPSVCSGGSTPVRATPTEARSRAAGRGRHGEGRARSRRARARPSTTCTRPRRTAARRRAPVETALDAAIEEARGVEHDVRSR